MKGNFALWLQFAIITTTNDLRQKNKRDGLLEQVSSVLELLAISKDVRCLKEVFFVLYALVHIILL